MEKNILEEIISFTTKYERNIDIYEGTINYAIKAGEYLRILRDSFDMSSALTRALEDKLLLISTSVGFHDFWDLSNILAEENSITEFIITSIKKRRLTDPKLIIRFAYIELAKYLYYDISITKITDEKTKKLIVNTPVDPKMTKVFSYVICSQWLQLFKYILSKFGIHVKEMNRAREYHVWGEIELNDEIIIVDATDYINSSIDLSNAKSMSPTKGFIILPKRYSGLKFQEVYTNPNHRETLKEITKYYDANRELDTSLGYIKNGIYPIEALLCENDLFQNSNEFINGEKEIERYINRVKEFLLNFSIPNNMDGYEVFAYYHMLISKLPLNIRGNISMKTLYVDTYEYKQTRLRKKYLRTDIEYLKYLQELVYSRYYQYLNEPEFNEILSSIKAGVISNEELTLKILKQELLIAEINRRLNPYYAINELIVYNPFAEDNDMYQLYEPSSGKSIFTSSSELLAYKKLNKIL